jgi:hypothetical protein
MDKRAPVVDQTVSERPAGVIHFEAVDIEPVRAERGKVVAWKLIAVADEGAGPDGVMDPIEQFQKRPGRAAVCVIDQVDHPPRLVQRREERKSVGVVPMGVREEQKDIFVAFFKGPSKPSYSTAGIDYEHLIIYAYTDARRIAPIPHGMRCGGSNRTTDSPK